MRNMANVEEAEVFDYKPERAVIQGVKALENADVLIGHNIIGYDIDPFFSKNSIQTLTPRGEVVDTLTFSSVLSSYCR